MRTAYKHIIIILFLFAGFAANSNPNSIHLNGIWKFHIGDNAEWAQASFNDSSWSSISVPGAWEDQGYNGYDGFAWYRKKIRINEAFQFYNLILEMGYVDDVDAIYFNGVKIGQSGAFPPKVRTAYNAKRSYSIPSQIVNFTTENTIAIRVYDSRLSGGIISGDCKIFTSGVAVQLAVNLSGNWLLNKGKQINEDEAFNILVPGIWENQGFHYDGYAVYSKKVEIQKSLLNDRIIFMVGKIDDLDRVYINGEFICGTGEYEKKRAGQEYLEFRNYFIPGGILKEGENIFEIRVYDQIYDGGIVEGPVGLVKQKDFIKYWMSKRKN